MLVNYTLHPKRDRLDDSQRQVAHLSFPLAFPAALCDEKEIVDSLANWNGLPDSEQSWHGLAIVDTGKGVRRHGAYIMGEKDTPFPRSPIQDHRILCSREAHVLGAHNIQFRQPA